jgi:hypothetical protein
LVDAMQIDEHKLIRIDNPHGPTAGDYQSPLYGESCAFWTEHPELADKLADAIGGGNWWMGWDELLAVGGLCGGLRQPLPAASYPYVKVIDHELRPTAVRWPSLSDLRKHQTHKIILTEPTTLSIATSWEPGSIGDRHSFWFLTQANKTTLLIERSVTMGWWSSERFVQLPLPAGTYWLNPGAVDQHKDTGVVQVMLLGNKPIEVA